MSEEIGLVKERLASPFHSSKSFSLAITRQEVSFVVIIIIVIGMPILTVHS